MTSDFGFNGTRRVPPPVNEPVKGYAPGSPERAALKARLERDGRRSGSRSRSSSAAGRSAPARPRKAVMPHDHAPRARRLAQGRAGARRAGDRGRGRGRAREWASWPWEDRAAVFLQAAELLATTWRATLNAATMLGQSKTAFQAEIDSACELIDFWRFNPHYAQELLRRAAALERHDVEPARLPAARGLRLRGDAVQLHVDRRQPADRARADGQHRRLEAGLVRDPERLLHHEAARGGGPAARASSTSCPATRRPISDVVLTHRDLAGVHFTGSTAVFNSMWKTIGARHGPLPLLPAHRRRDRRQGLHRRARVGRPAGARGRDRARRLRVPGAEVLGREPHLRPALALEGRARPHRRR